MSGHSKWSTIKRQKGVADAKRSAVFGKLARQIAIAARDGKDPDSNFRLRLAIDRARAVNMPNGNIDRAIKTGSGELKGDQMKEILYEGYGPGRVAILAQALTDNPNRTAGDIRSIFNKHGGSLGATNSVAWMFTRRGVARVPLAIISTPRDTLELEAIDAGAEDVVESDGGVEFLTSPEKLFHLRDWLVARVGSVEQAEVVWVPNTTVDVADTDRSTLDQLLEHLDDHDDISSLYTNEA